MGITYPEQAVCVIGSGCVLPDAASPADFWKNLLEGRCSIRDIPDHRWKRNLYFSPESQDPDLTRVATAAWIDDQTLEQGGFPGPNRLHRITQQAASQAVGNLSLEKVDPRRIHIYLGCMDPDEAYAVWRFPIREIPLVRERLAAFPGLDPSLWCGALEKYVTQNTVSAEEFRRALFSGSVLHGLRHRFGWSGEVGLIDAACASSLAALDHSMRLLQTGEADLVLSGGIESNLGPESFVLFSILGALAPERCLPFDRRGKGLSLGEGAVLFALERLEDALRLNHPILGILNSSGSSSDGRASSLFAPTVAGQKRAFAEAYEGLDPRDLVFLECHGTGTRTGDETELRSTTEFFARPDLPMGSVKALIGHTKGAAGAAGLLKCLLSLEHRLLPPSPYFRDSLIPNLRPNINTSPVPLPSGERPALMGISGFGFGGINYHLVLQEYRSGGVVNRMSHPAPLPVYLSVDRTYSFEQLSHLNHLERFNLPPNSRRQIDPAQLASLAAVAEITREHHLDWSLVDPGLVSVIAAGTLGLEGIVDLTSRLRYAEMRELFSRLPEEVLKSVIALKERFPTITPDSSPGVLNNVTAGRVANAYDFHGPTFNVDADFNSMGLAVRMATHRLARRPGIVIVLGIQERLTKDASGLERTGIRCQVLSTTDLAWKCGLPLGDTIVGHAYFPATQAANTSASTMATRGIHEDGYDLCLAPDAGIDPSRLAILFSGQGSARPGMFKDFHQHLPRFREFFAKADQLAATVGVPAVSSFVLGTATFEGEILARVRNLAMFVAQTAAFDAVIQAGWRPTVVSGFSQGEYAALAASGVLSFEEAFAIIAERDRVSSPPNRLGYMMAVAASPDRLAELLPRSSFFISCIGTPTQTTISVEPHHTAEVHQTLQKAGILVTILEVPQPYHTSMMRPVADHMRSFLRERKIRFGVPRIPLFSCVSHTLIDACNAGSIDWVDLISRQSTEIVDFVGQTAGMRALSCGSFLEIGPGRALQKFIGTMLSAEPHRLLDLTRLLLPESVKPAAKGEITFDANPLLQLMQRAIARVTGYQLDRITIEDRFQDDLGIDSLKTAEIILEVMKESGRRLNPTTAITEFKDVRSAVEMLQQAPIDNGDSEPPQRPAAFIRGRVEWRPAPPAFPTPGIPSPEVGSASPAIFMLELSEILTGSRSQQEVVASLQGSATRPVLVLRGDHPLIGWERGFPGDAPKQLVATIGRILLWFQSLATIWTEPAFDLFLLTSSAGHPAIQGLASFFSSFGREHPGMVSRSLHFSGGTCQLTSQELAKMIDRERRDLLETAVRYVGRERLVPVWVPLPKVAPTRAPGVVAAFGGAKGITFALLERIARKGMHIAIAGRSPSSDPTVAENLVTLRRTGATVTYQPLDAADPSAVFRFLERVRRLRRRIDLVINGTGVEVSKPLVKKTADEIHQELCGKLLPAMNVFAASRKVKPGLVVQFSSIIARSANHGQTVYGCANGIIDALTEAFFADPSHPPAVAIDWPPWQGVGMTARAAVMEGFRRLGVSLLDPDQAARLFAEELAGPSLGVVEYYEPHDLPAILMPTIRLEALRPLLGEPTSGRAFTKRFSLEGDPYLRDHRLGDHCLVPAATAICMAFWFARLNDHRLNVLERIQIHSPMTVSAEGLTVGIEGIDSPLQIFIRSRVPHVSAWGGGEAPLPKHHGTRTGERPSNASEYSLEGLYEGRFFHGPVFQLLHRGFHLPNGTVRTEIQRARLLPIFGNPLVDLPILAIDAAFQTIALNAMERISAMSIPVGVERIAFFGIDHSWKVLSLEVTDLRLTGGTIRANVDLVDECGNLTLRIEGAELKEIRRVSEDPKN